MNGYPVKATKWSLMGFMLAELLAGMTLVVAVVWHIVHALLGDAHMGCCTG